MVLATARSWVGVEKQKTLSLASSFSASLAAPSKLHRHGESIPTAKTSCRRHCWYRSPGLLLFAMQTTSRPRKMTRWQPFLAPPMSMPATVTVWEALFSNDVSVLSGRRFDNLPFCLLCPCSAKILPVLARWLIQRLAIASLFSTTQASRP
ncbi:hypothetical protein CBM2633_B40138 [Cupriavidus taiwanensis]|uniref:Uncharacterized protein n=1 Tax=Cupriavidus taiwanensis TaxID=164546 RepID=A0A375EC59_9BURK|nr:hypothetical protein CBM2614_B50038 [Cupriavidus taiwanensis]SOZ69678.1 hypothetical protein CBM2615_B60037 [Cupriavidus taiwanensis]SOZ72889.1 hypothetical protein CBM2613_B50037 [Cupriavidus taiwanensis]SPA09747.1 hypothetical protein CBM2625_B50036 [Cupriavidus taiwanensis]SPA22011.1 hypothetical protein CBM2633_B40138 [Cupriavidus taiwanensis]